MIKENCIILTGAPGSGKSTLLRLLQQKGYTCVDEPARQIISEQRAIQGSGVSDRNPSLFIELMLSRAISRYQDVPDTAGTVIFDRGIADNIAYAMLYDLPFEHGWAAAARYRSNSRVFFAPNWRDIYATDEERTMTFEASAVMGDSLRMIYQKLGYEIVELPLSGPEDRVKFMINNCPERLVG
jgi:predicted ATPase